ncbi:hypothetical protein C5S42_01305, partial [Candidatus Methanomarinus sp.]
AVADARDAVQAFINGDELGAAMQQGYFPV